MKNKVIFLDIDGVLNSNDWVEQQIAKNNPRCNGTDMVDEAARDRLTKFLDDHPDIKLVISSSWRWHNLEETKEKFRQTKLACLCKYMIGVTPRTWSGIRGREIEMYLNEHPSIEKWVIVDDEEHDIHQKSKLVKTTWAHGLLDEHIEQIKEMLK